MSDPSTWSHPMVPNGKHGPPSVIHAGLMRTGTLSLARAYDILGLRAHHGLDMANMPNDLGNKQWALFERAAEGSWPSVPGARPAKRFTRADWDLIFGDFDAVTDVAAVFADQLFEAYPDAKVVIVEREFEAWWASFQTQVLDGLFNPFLGAMMSVIGLLTGMRAAKAMQKIVLGSFAANNAQEARQNAREMHRQFYARIREIVPAEQRLEYKLGDGWEPLCAFLGKKVPDVEFPRVNDKVEHRARQMKEGGEIIRLCWTIVRPWVLGFGSLSIILVAVWLTKG